MGIMGTWFGSIFAMNMEMRFISRRPTSASKSLGLNLLALALGASLGPLIVELFFLYITVLQPYPYLYSGVYYGVTGAFALQTLLQTLAFLQEMIRPKSTTILKQVDDALWISHKSLKAHNFTTYISWGVIGVVYGLLLQLFYTVLYWLTRI